MARARNIKPSLFKNELLGEADPLLTILFQGLWCLADKEGRLEDRPRRIKVEIFPYRELPDFNRYLTELARLGFIERYEVENQAIIQVVNFVKHQSPHKTEKPSELPAKPSGARVTFTGPSNNGSLTVKESLIPDSLIPDSLIPDSSQENTSSDFIDTPELNLTSDSPPDGLRQRFEKFWLDFPGDLGSKGSKADAQKQFLKLKPDDILLASMRRALIAQSRHKRECRSQGQFAENFPHVVRWLSKRRWEDEIPSIQNFPVSVEIID